MQLFWNPTNSVPSSADKGYATCPSKVGAEGSSFSLVPIQWNAVQKPSLAYPGTFQWFLEHSLQIGQWRHLGANGISLELGACVSVWSTYRDQSESGLWQREVWSPLPLYRGFQLGPPCYFKKKMPKAQASHYISPIWDHVLDQTSLTTLFSFSQLHVFKVILVKATLQRRKERK